MPSRHFLSRKGGSGKTSGHRSTSGGSSRHTIRVYETGDEDTPSRSQMRHRERLVVEGRSRTSSTADRSSRRSASHRESLPSYGSSSYRNSDRVYNMSSLRGTLPSSYQTTSHRNDYKKHDRSSRHESLPSRSQYHYDDYPTTSKARKSKYEYYDENGDCYEVEEVDAYPTTSKSRQSKHDYYDDEDDYAVKSKSRRSKYDYDDDDDEYLVVSAIERQADPTWRQEVSAGDYDKYPVNITSSKSRRLSQSEYLRQNFDCEDAEGTVEAFMERDEDDEPDVVRGRFAFRRKRH